MTLIRLRDRLGGVRYLAVAVAFAAVFAWGTSAEAVIVFSDDFSTSTLNQTSTPTGGNATSYDIASNKNQSPASSIGAGHLKFGMAQSSSALDEAQAVFTSSPITLATANDFIEMTLTFTNAAGVITSGTAAQLDIGLYSSGGVAPRTDLASTGISALTDKNAGGTKGWQGYETQIFNNTTNSRNVFRPAQTGTDNTVQDLVGNNFSSSNSYHTAAGTNLPNTSAPVGNLTATSQYTEDLKITLMAAGTYTIATNLYSGSTATGTPLTTITSTGVTGANFVSGIDALAIGYRGTDSTVATQIDINSLTISDLVSVPEVSSFLMVGLVGVVGLAVRQAHRRESLDPPATV